MKRKRLRIVLLAGLVSMLILVVVVLRALSRLFAPDTYGIDARVFANPGKAAAPVTTFVPSLREAPRAPNIIVILADDLGSGDLGIAGSQALTTPNIDRLAAEGLRLTTCYAAAPVCSPSRAGLLTGRYPLRSGIITALPAAKDTFMRTLTRTMGMGMAQMGTVDMAGGDNAVYGLPPSEITMAEALQTADYDTMAIGKWHLGDFTERPEYHPFNQGFGHFVGFNMSNDDWPVAFWRGEEELIEDIGIDQAHYTGLFTEEAVGFIEEERDAPFFLYLAHKDPHQPFFPAEDFAGKSKGGPYGDAVAELDWSVGQVVDAVRRSGIAENTLIVFTSDNGPWFEGSPGALRGRKGQSYEGGFRVPCVAWWPGRIPEGSVTDAPVSHLDLFPTFMKLAGLGTPTDRITDGMDLSGLLSDPAAPLPERALYFFHDYDVEALREGRWKYYRSNSHYTWPVPLDKLDNIAGQISSGHHYKPPGSDESIPTLGTWPLLYNLETDPGEAYNIAEHQPQRTEEMAQRLDAWHTQFLANPRGWHSSE